MKKRGQQGFTLIEIVMALFVLSVVLLALNTMVISVMQSTAQSKEMAKATTLVQDKLESLRHVRIDLLTSGSESIAEGNITYLRQWMIATSGNIKTITVAVNWTNRGSHNISMTTLRGA